METHVSTLTATAVRIAAGTNHDEGKNPDIPALLAFWKENKCPLLALNHDSLKTLENSPEFNTAREAERNLLSSLKSEYDLVRRQWAKAGISCLVIKSGGTFPSFPYTSDNLDVLVREEQEQAARAILQEQGYVELRNIEEPKKFLFRKFNGGDCVSAIHLHTQVGWEVGFMDEDSLWHRARPSPDDETIIIPSAEDIILITIAHSFYENKRFRLSDIMKIRECLQQGMIDWDYMDGVARQRGWIDGLHFCLLLYTHLEKTLWGEASIPPESISAWKNSLKRKSSVYRYYRRTLRSPVTLPYKISFTFSKVLYYKKILHDQHYSFGRRIADVIRTLMYGIKLKLRVRPQPSFLVSFSGPDGSGKTQHAQTLIKAVRQCGIKTKYCWSRTATSGLFRFCSTCAKILMRNKVEVRKSGSGVAGRREQLRNPLLRFLWSYLVAADMIFTYFFRVRLLMLRGKVMVCDRYIFDAAAEMACSLFPNDKINRLAIKLMLTLAPKPDIAYLLDIPEDICAQRKVEDTEPDYLRQQRRVYTALAARYNLYTKKTDGDFSVIAGEILREVTTPYYSNFRTFLNGLFLSNPDQLNPRHKGAK